MCCIWARSTTRGFGLASFDRGVGRGGGSAENSFAPSGRSLRQASARRLDHSVEALAASPLSAATMRGLLVALSLREDLQLDRFWAARHPASRKGTRWDQELFGWSPIACWRRAASGGCWFTAMRRGFFQPEAGPADLRLGGVSVHRGQRSSRPRHDRHVSAAVLEGYREAVCRGSSVGGRDGRAEDGHDRTGRDEDPRQRQPAQRAFLCVRGQPPGRRARGN